MNFSQFFKVYLENKQLADKIYIKPGLVSGPDYDKILAITGGNNYTLFLTSVFSEDPKTDLKAVYRLLREYNPRVFPIEGFDLMSTDNNLEIFLKLKYRENCIKELNKLPSIARRNLLEDIRNPRSDFWNLYNTLEYINLNLRHLENRPENIRNVIMKKIFSSKVESFEMLSNLLDEKESLIGGKIITKNKIKNIIDETNYEYSLLLVHESDDVWVVRVGDAEGIKKIGDISLWCFTYGGDSGRMWESYSTNEYVYVIINWKREHKEYMDPYFMVVVIKPLDEEDEEDVENGEGIGYDLTNYPIYTKQYISELGLDTTLFNFED